MRRIQITLPDRLAEEIRKTAPPRKRSRFIAEAVEEKLDRLRFARAVDEALNLPAWEDKDHPELSAGAAAHIRAQRARDEKRRR